MAQSPQFNDSQNALLAKIAANTGESQPKVGDGQHNLLFKIAQNTYASAVTSSSALQSSGDGYVLAQHGDNLATKYAEAKTKSPSATNRITLFIVPGTYTLSSQLEIDAEYVDLVGLGAQFQSPAVIVSNNTLNVTANDVRVSGISVGTNSFKLSNNKSLAKLQNCIGGNFSFAGGNGSICASSFIGCIGGNFSFGGSGGAIAQATGYFKDCVGGERAFGGGSSNATASGIFYNCIGGRYSFGGNGGIVSGELINCRLIFSGETFTSVSGSGIIRFCLDGDNNIVNADAP